VEPVVAGHVDDASPSRTQRVEDLNRCIRPHLQQWPERITGKLGLLSSFFSITTSRL
jgi:hypothetical protein